MTENSSAGGRFSPRRMELAALVAVLVDEHRKMQEGIRKVKAAAESGDFESVGKALRELDPVFRQHIADEEAQILALLIAEFGVKGAEREISVFRQHRPIYKLMSKVSELAAQSSSQLEAGRSELQKLFEEHTALEEKEVFPKALSLPSRDRV